MVAIVEAYQRPDGDRRALDAAEDAATEIRVALTLTRRAADGELDLALDLHRRLPRVWEALVAGRIDRRRAWVLVTGTEHLPDGAARIVIERIIEDASGLTTGQLRARLRRLCIEADPEDAARSLEAAHTERRVVTQSRPDGTVDLLGIGLAPDRAAAAMERLNRIARSLRGPGEGRSMDQLRVDVFCDLLDGTGHHAARAGTVELTVDVATLIGLSENPGTLAGYGPVIADIARRITREQRRATWQYTVRNPATGVTYVGVTRRRPDTDLGRRVRTRYRTCVFPGCRMPAVNCDLDHRDPVADGGPTTEWHLAPLCRHDHCARHTGWTYRRLANGTHEWTSPLGHTYTTRDEPP
jgi:hypothetical protein